MLPVELRRLHGVLQATQGVRGSYPARCEQETVTHTYGFARLAYAFHVSGGQIEATSRLGRHNVVDHSGASETVILLSHNSESYGTRHRQSTDFRNRIHESHLSA